MALVKAQGLIIKSVKFGEANRILTVLTREFGKIQVAANNVGRGKGGATSSQMFAYSNFTLFRGQKSLYRLNDADCIEFFDVLRSDLEKLSYAAYFADLTCSITSENNADDEKLLNLLLNALHLLCKGTPNLRSKFSFNEGPGNIPAAGWECHQELVPANDTPVKTAQESKTQVAARLDAVDRLANPNNGLHFNRKIKLVFELRAISLAGFMPDFDCCHNCGIEQNINTFDLVNSVVRCKNCIMVAPNIAEFNDTLLNACRYITMAEMNKIFSFEMNDELLVYLSDIIERYVAIHIDKRLQSLDYLKGVLRNG